MKFRLTDRAKRDFRDIFDFGLSRFGLNQAQEYARGLEELFQQAGDMPLMFPELEVAGQSFRRAVSGSHAVYYVLEGDGVTIVRVLGRQKLGSALLVADNTP